MYPPKKVDRKGSVKTLAERAVYGACSLGGLREHAQGGVKLRHLGMSRWMDGDHLGMSGEEISETAWGLPGVGAGSQRKSIEA